MKKILLLSITIVMLVASIAFAAKSTIRKATGPNAVTVEEAYRDSAKLSGNVVVIRGKVVKVTAGIMDKNWIHLQDGTSYNGQYDLTCTTSGELPAKDTIVTVTGRLATNRDFGAGYFYSVIVEDASFRKK